MIEEKFFKKSLPELIDKNEVFTLYIPKTVSNKIQYVCDEIPNNEWSGILFYKYEGSLLDINNLRAEVVDILPLDIGSAGFTSNEFPKEYSEFLLKNPHMMEYNHGIVHSHNNMGVFFSGTDNEALAKISDQYAGLISLIVNNKGEYCAKLGVYIKADRVDNITVRDIDYKDKVLSENVSVGYVKVYNAKIEKEVINVDLSFQNRIYNLRVNSELQNANKERNLFNQGGFYNNPDTPSRWINPKVDDKLPVPLKNKKEDSIDICTEDVDYINFICKVISFNPFLDSDCYDFEEDFNIAISAYKGKDVLNEGVINNINSVLRLILYNNTANPFEIKDMCKYLILELEELELKRIYKGNVKELIKSLITTFSRYLENYNAPINFSE